AALPGDARIERGGAVFRRTRQRESSEFGKSRLKRYEQEIRKKQAGTVWSDMFQVSVEETFSAGHALRGYKGKCENPHGHNYRVRVPEEGPKVESDGLHVDFVHVNLIVR